jgi:hypothetical protein
MRIVVLLLIVSLSYTIVVKQQSGQNVVQTDKAALNEKNNSAKIQQAAQGVEKIQEEKIQEEKIQQAAQGDKIQQASQVEKIQEAAQGDQTQQTNKIQQAAQGDQGLLANKIQQASAGGQSLDNQAQQASAGNIQHTRASQGVLNRTDEVQRPPVNNTVIPEDEDEDNDWVYNNTQPAVTSSHSAASISLASGDTAISHSIAVNTTSDNVVPENNNSTENVTDAEIERIYNRTHSNRTDFS